MGVHEKYCLQVFFLLILLYKWFLHSKKGETRITLTKVGNADGFLFPVEVPMGKKKKKSKKVYPAFPIVQIY